MGTRRCTFTTVIVAASATRLLLLLLALPAAVQAQFTYTTNNGTITITGYGDPQTVEPLTIPDTIDGLPVTSIGNAAFDAQYYLPSITIPAGVTSIGRYAFYDCYSLSSVNIPEGVTRIEESTFSGTGLTTVTIPNSVTSIGVAAFYSCIYLTGVDIGYSVTNIEDAAFSFCTSLKRIYFHSNAPAFFGFLPNMTTVYYLPGTTGWGPTFAGRPTALWSLPNPLILTSGSSFGAQTNAFGFIISWATNLSVVVEACTNLVNPKWSPLGTNTLNAGSSYFSDPPWTNYSTRFYRLRSP